MPRIVFTPSGLTGDVLAGVSVLDAARRLGVDLDSVCGGRGICGRCQVVRSDGAFAKWSITSSASALTEVSDTERNYHGRRALTSGHRLGCAAHVVGDVVVDVPADSQVHRQVVRKSVNLDGVVVDPIYSLLYAEVPAAALGDGRSVVDSLRDALSRAHGRTFVAVDADVLPALHRAVATDAGAVTVALRHQRAGDEVAAVWPGFVDVVGGVAVDIGSTTIAGHLCDLASGEVLASAGRMNPQIRFGEDLMSRVSYVMMNPGGERELTSAVRTAVDDLIGELVDAAGFARDRVLDVVAVGNPIMHHLLLGIDPTPLGTAPFTLATADAVATTAAAIELALPNARAYVGPCIAGHVGADTTAAMLAEGPHRGSEFQLLVDVGTNAEIVLGCRDVQYAASSPTGPAFEGAQISCGQRATAGAIERVRIDRDTFEPRVKVIGCTLWSDEPGFDEATSDLAISGVCGSGIIEVIGEMFLAGIVAADGTLDGSLRDRTARVVADGRTYAYVLYERGATRLAITQNDVRAIQLAKAALRAGIDLLLEHAGIESVADIRLAGAFGAHIDPLYALVLGLVPDCPPDRVRSVGNAAGAGAVRALLSAALRRELESAARAVTKIETATEPRFQDLFVAAMSFPHASAPTRHLERAVALPERAPVGNAAGRSPRRRRSQERQEVNAE